MCANNKTSQLQIYNFITTDLCRMIVLFLSVTFAPLAFSAGWKEIRTAASGNSGWQYLVCQSGTGWSTCEVDLVITQTATPNQLVAIGEQSTIVATVTDAYGKAVEAGVRIGWASTDGSISAAQTVTDSNGKTSVVLTSSRTLGGATVTATSIDYGGSGSIYVPFIDKWVAYPSAYTGWSDYGAVYSCTGWSPDPSTVAAGTWFTQYANCWQTQIRYRQDRVQSVVTGAIINSGSSVAEFQGVVVSITQGAVGTMYVPPPGPICKYDNQNYISLITVCRGGGTSNHTFLMIDGIKYRTDYQDFNQRDPQGYYKYILRGTVYYKGAELGGTGVGCAGEPGVASWYAACHD